ncbi:hypothetical protein G9A89_004739 [Geosiphon pyriformis]|nr:hypothetical protein G9A89_004739 [Geosiphon pyriformis]
MDCNTTIVGRLLFASSPQERIKAPGFHLALFACFFMARLSWESSYPSEISSSRFLHSVWRCIGGDQRQSGRKGHNRSYKFWTSPRLPVPVGSPAWSFEKFFGWKSKRRFCRPRSSFRLALDTWVKVTFLGSGGGNGNSIWEKGRIHEQRILSPDMHY